MQHDLGDESNPPQGADPGIGGDAPSGDEAQWAAAGGEDAVRRTTEKDPDEWVTGDEPPTGAQLSYLETLAREVGETVPERLTKAEASKLIDELRARSGRARDSA